MSKSYQSMKSKKKKTVSEEKVSTSNQHAIFNRQNWLCNKNYTRDDENSKNNNSVKITTDDGNK